MKVIFAKPGQAEPFEVSVTVAGRMRWADVAIEVLEEAGVKAGRVSGYQLRGEGGALLDPEARASGDGTVTFGPPPGKGEDDEEETAPRAPPPVEPEAPPPVSPEELEVAVAEHAAAVAADEKARRATKAAAEATASRHAELEKAAAKKVKA